MAAGVIAAAPVAVGMLQDYQRTRLFCFLDPYADAQGACYQLVQALNAVGSGGWLGRGLTVGGEDQRGYIPVQSTDFIFTVVAEDLGFVGGIVVLVLFGLLVWRILLIGWQSRDAFGMLIAVGLASMILFQLLVNVGMVVGIMPVTGIPLPFVTYGGSSLISLLFGLGHPPVDPDAEQQAGPVTATRAPRLPVVVLRRVVEAPRARPEAGPRGSQAPARSPAAGLRIGGTRIGTGRGRLRPPARREWRLRCRRARRRRREPGSRPPGADRPRRP